MARMEKEHKEMMSKMGEEHEQYMKKLYVFCYIIYMLIDVDLIKILNIEMDGQTLYKQNNQNWIKNKNNMKRIIINNNVIWYVIIVYYYNIFIFNSMFI